MREAHPRSLLTGAAIPNNSSHFPPREGDLKAEQQGRKGCQTTSIPTLQVSCVPTRTAQIKYPKVLIFVGKREQFARSLAPLHPSARARECVMKES